MRVLAIETSCDETGVAIVEGREEGGAVVFDVQGAALLSQAALHAEYGGVYPNLAKREHEKNLPVILEQALAGKRVDVNAIAVTHGPGLEPALWTGITFAQKLAQETGLPLMGVNHMEGHLISSLVQNGRLEDVQFPVLGLLISGGHTEFVVMKDWFEYQIVGKTLDDAVGEAFDKVARLLELPYPGGPHISRLADAARRAEKSHGKEARLPRPMLKSNSCDMSFSGLKTAALYALRDKKLTDDEKAAFAREFEDAVGDVFVEKTRKALLETGAKTFVIGGGVAANRYLRERLQQLVLDDFDDIEFRLPELSITGDNAIMIGEAALLRMLKLGVPEGQGEELRAVGNLSL
jgi:N6-L-threonylcarbamoyladenine synthase